MARWEMVLQTCATTLHYGFLTNVLLFTAETTATAAFKSIANYLRRYLEADIINEVIFFPDPLTLKKQGSFECSRVLKPSYTPSALEECALDKLINYLSSAKMSIDLCIFTVSCSELADAVIRKHKEGVIVRVVTDNEQIELHCSQIDKFRREGIQVRNDRTSFLMHHKFVVVDSKLLISGSFNWTRQALVGNKENVIISNNTELVTAFRREFEKLWDEYDVEHRSRGVQTSGIDLRPTLRS